MELSKLRNLEPYTQEKLEKFSALMVQRYGSTQMFIAIEELLELQEAINLGCREDIIGELADCYITIRQVCVAFGYINNITYEKTYTKNIIYDTIIPKAIRCICRGMREGILNTDIIDELYFYFLGASEIYGISEKEMNDKINYKINRTVDRIEEKENA